MSEGKSAGGSRLKKPRRAATKRSGRPSSPVLATTDLTRSHLLPAPPVKEIVLLDPAVARSTLNNLAVAVPGMVRATRLAAVQAEVQKISEVWWSFETHNHGQYILGPRAIVKRTRAARYRMPRRLKHELLERFCAGADCADLTMPTVMIVAAHPDDESIGAGSRLWQLTRTYVVHVTDGAPRDPNVARRYGFATREEYAEARRLELQEAMKLAGVPDSRLVWLGYTDGEASLRLVDLVLDIAQLIDEHRPEIVVTHPYEGGHTDHDAAAFAVHLACGILKREGVQPPAVLEMASYHDRDGHRVLQQFIPHAGADLEQREIVLPNHDRVRKERMFASFYTQQGVLREFNSAIERYRPAPRYLFTRPPHPGRLNYEKYGDAHRGEWWRENAESALSKLRLRAS